LVKATAPLAGTTTALANGMSVSTPAANECTWAESRRKIERLTI
jgi:hypothetical protein